MSAPLARIARLSAAFLGSNIVRGGVAFALSLVLGRALGVERFGRWVLCSTWASTLTVLADLGLGMLLTRDGARVAGSGFRVAGSLGSRGSLGSQGSMGSLCGGAVVIRALAAVAGALAMIVGASWLAGDPETVRGLQMAAILGVAGAVYGCFGAAFRSQPAWVPAILTLETAWHAAQLAVSWLLLRAAPSTGIPLLIAVAVVVQVAQIVSALALWRAAFGHAGRLRITSWSETRAIVRRALPFAGIGVIANLQTRLAPLMLGYLATQTELGAFGAAAKFGATARLAPGAIFAGALPVLSEEHATRDDARASAAFGSFDRAFAIVAVATALPGILFARPLLALVYGRAFVTAAPALACLCVGLIPMLTNSAAKIALYAAGAERDAIVWSGTSLAIQALSGAAFIPRFGALGAAAAIALAETLIWLPLRRARTAARTRPPSSPHRASAPTFEPQPPIDVDAADPAAAG